MSSDNVVDLHEGYETVWRCNCGCYYFMLKGDGQIRCGECEIESEYPFTIDIEVDLEAMH